MAMNLDAILKITAQVLGQSNVDKLQRSLGTMEATARQAKGSFKGIIDSSAWQAAGVAAAGIGVALGTSVNEAIKFESAMADVKKVVDGLDDPGALREMENAIIDLSRELPITAEGLTQIVAAAGQAGIAQEELLDFARSAAQMGVAFDITADQAGEAMAKMRTSMGLSQGEVVNLADAMNYLSNVQASSAGEITDFMLRVGAFGQQVAMTEEQTAALGSAMIAAGAAPEVAATSFRNLIKEMAAGVNATDKQEAAWERLGLSATEVARRMQEDAVGTMRDVFQRLAKLPAEVQIPTIEVLFGNEARALTPLIKNLDLFEASMAAVGNQSNYAGSMLKEFEARSGTTANQMQLFKNNVQALQIEIGGALLPALNGIATAILPIVSGVSRAASQFPVLTQAVVALAAAISALVLALPFIASFLSIMSSLGAMGVTLAGVGAVIAGIGATIAGWAGAVVPALGVVVAALKTLGAILAGVFTGPVGWVALLAAAVIALIAFREPVGQFFGWLGQQLQQWIAGLWQWGEPVRQFWVGLWESVKTIAGGFFQWFSSGLYAWFVQPWITVGGAIVNAVAGIWEQVKGPILGFMSWWYTTLYQIFLEPWVLVWSKLTEAASVVWDVIKAAASAFWGWWTSAVDQYIAQPFLRAVDAVLSVMGGMWDGIKSAASSFWGWIQQQVQQHIVVPFTVARDEVVRIWSELTTLIGNAWGAITGAFDANVVQPIKSAWQALQDWMSGIVQGAASAVARAYESIAGGILGAFRGIVGTVGRVINSIIDAINGFIRGVNSIRSAVGLSTFGLISQVSIPTFAEGGFVRQPTMAIVGEGGEPEYIVPESKMAAAAANYLSGARGDAVLSAAPAVAMAAAPSGGMRSSGPAQINITTGPVMEMDSRRYVTIEDLQSAVRQTQAQIYGTLRTPAGRRAIGVA